MGGKGKVTRKRKQKPEVRSNIGSDKTNFCPTAITPKTIRLFILNGLINVKNKVEGSGMNQSIRVDVGQSPTYLISVRMLTGTPLLIIRTLMIGFRQSKFKHVFGQGVKKVRFDFKYLY